LLFSLEEKQEEELSWKREEKAWRKRKNKNKK
jgi:hypothetical protein